jgi:hypothetical protein
MQQAEHLQMIRPTKPFPGELLSSAVVRCCRDFRLSTGELGTQLLGKQCFRVNFFLGMNLPAAAELFKIPPNELLTMHTQFPYASAYVSDAVRLRAARDALMGNEKSAALRSLMQNAAQGCTYRRVCQKCIKADIRQLGLSYWRREHNLPGCAMCLEHDEPLRQTSILAARNHRATYELPHECASRSLPFQVTPAVADLSRRSASLLSSAGRVAQVPDAIFYRDLAVSRGWLDEGRPVSTLALADAVRSRFHRSFLVHHELVPERRAGNWAGLMFQPRIGLSFSPIKHLLLQTIMSAHRTPEEPTLSHVPSGPAGTPEELLDAHCSRQARVALQEALRKSAVLTTEQFLRLAGCLGTYRHRKDDLPLLRRAVLQFRASAASVKQLRAGKTLFRKRPDEIVT